MDDLNTPNPFDPPPEEVVAIPAEPVAKGGKLGAFFGTTLGKVVLIGGALAVLGAVIAVIAVVVLGFLGANMVQDGLDEALNGNVPGAPGGVVSTTTLEVVEATSVPLAVANSAVFTFRDIFEPLARETVVSPTEGGTGGSTTGTGTGSPSTFDGAEDTLYLLDVITEDGVRHAVLFWNGATYTLAAGEAIEGTPWRVISVGADSVRMLYGDSTVTLRVGQGSVAAK